MLKDTLRDSWTYQKVLGEGRVEEARRSIEIVANARFPETLTYIKNQIISLTDEMQLQKILSTIAIAQTAEEVKQALSVVRNTNS